MVVAAVLTLALAGCSEEPRPGTLPVFSVCGFASWEGEPMSGAVITFHRRDSHLSAQGVADQDGVYYLTTYLTDDGAAAGDYSVTIYWPDAKAPPSTDPDPPLAPDLLKQAYANAKTTKLSATVREEDNSIDFRLP